MNNTTLIGYNPALVNNCDLGTVSLSMVDTLKEKDPTSPELTISEAIICQYLVYHIKHYPANFLANHGQQLSYNDMVKGTHFIFSYWGVVEIIASLKMKGVLNVFSTKQVLCMKRAKGSYKLYLSFKDKKLQALATAKLVYFSPEDTYKVGIKAALIWNNLKHWTATNDTKASRINPESYRREAATFDGWIAQPTHQLSILLGIGVRTIQRCFADLASKGILEIAKLTDGTMRYKLQPNPPELAPSHKGQVRQSMNHSQNTI